MFLVMDPSVFLRAAIKMVLGDWMNTLGSWMFVRGGAKQVENGAADV
jgi:hypothetical protein